MLKSAIYLYVEGELQNDEEHGLAVVAHRIADLLQVVGRTEMGGHDRHGRARAAGGAFVPGGPCSCRADAWELPAVEPQTRPGRTG